MKNRCAAAYCFRCEKSRIIRSTFWVVGMSRYTASKSGCGSRRLEMDSITAGWVVSYGCDGIQIESSVRVTFSAKMSNCFRTDPSNF